MKVAIVSDTHFGHKENNKELRFDCYINAKQALDIAMEKADLVLMPGDLFDLEQPSEETYDFAFKIFKQYLGDNKLTLNPKRKLITKKPIIAIPGTHEYRGKDYKGPIHILESAGYLHMLEKEHVIVNDEIAVFGLFGVPEKVAKDVLLKLDFKPISGMKNILMLHQSFKEFLPFDDEMVASLQIEDLPEGFDLYINGHIHLHQKIESEKGLFILPGSTVMTQMRKNEIKNKKGFVIFDTETKETEFIQIPIQRDFSLKEIKIEKANKQEVIDKINDVIENTNLETKTFNLLGVEYLLKPILKIKIKGSLTQGYTTSDINPKDFEREDLIVVIDRKLDIERLEEKIKEMDINKDREEAIKNTSNIFLSNLEKSGFHNSFNPSKLIEHLEKKDLEKAYDYVLDSEIHISNIKKENNTEIIEEKEIKNEETESVKNQEDKPKETNTVIKLTDFLK
jgi:DNA repair protein SbcD/Mre11